MSILVRNIQLSTFSIIPGFLIGICWFDRVRILDKGFFHGYTLYTWLTVLMLSGGGLLIAVVVKYADSILKVIAATLSFLLSAFLSTYLFDFRLDKFFVVGSSLVIYGTWMYVISPQHVNSSINVGRMDNIV